MRNFSNIASLVRSKRLSHPKHYSQFELSQLLGYQNGQFISNVERALCSIPLKILSKVSTVLDVTEEELKESILKDYEQTLNSYFTSSDEVTNNVENTQNVTTNILGNSAAV